MSRTTFAALAVVLLGVLPPIARGQETGAEVVIRLRNGGELRGRLLGFASGRFEVLVRDARHVVREDDVVELVVVRAPAAPAPEKASYAASHVPPRVTEVLASPGRMTVGWEPSPESLYVVTEAARIERREEGSETWEVAGTTGGRENRFTDTGATPARYYRYRVVSIAVVDADDPVVQQHRTTLPAEERERASEPSGAYRALGAVEVVPMALAPVDSAGKTEVLLSVRRWDPDAGTWTSELARAVPGGAVAGLESATLVSAAFGVRGDPGLTAEVRWSRGALHGRGESWVRPAAGAGATPVAEALAGKRLLSLDLREEALLPALQRFARELDVNLLCLADHEAARVTLRVREVPLAEAWRLFLMAAHVEATPVGNVLAVHDAGQRVTGWTPLDSGVAGQRRLDLRVLAPLTLPQLLEAVSVATGVDVVLSAGARERMQSENLWVADLTARGLTLAETLAAALAGRERELRWTPRGNVILVYAQGGRYGPEDVVESLLTFLQRNLRTTYAEGEEELYRLLSPRLQATTPFRSAEEQLFPAWIATWKAWSGPRTIASLRHAVQLVQDDQGRWCIDAGLSPPAAQPTAPRDDLREQCDAQLRMIVDAAKRFASLKDAFPSDARDSSGAASIERLFKRGYLPPGFRPICPCHLDGRYEGFLKPWPADSPPNTPLVWDRRPHPDGKRGVAFVDGHCEALDPAAFEALLRAAGKEGVARLEDERIEEALRSGDREQVRALLAKAIEARPEAGWLWYRRGCVRMEQGDLEGALADLSHAIELGPNGGLYLARATARARRGGDFLDALADAEQAVQLMPESADAHALLSRLLGVKGRAADARAAADRAVELAPDDPQCLAVRAEARARVGDLAAAVQDIERSLALEERAAKPDQEQLKAWRALRDEWRARRGVPPR